MISHPQKAKVEYGDFQTPVELAELVCQKLVKLNINPDLIVEPTCGVGNFIQASVRCFCHVKKIIGVEINQNYLRELEAKKQLIQNANVEIIAEDFFQYD